MARDVKLLNYKKALSDLVEKGLPFERPMSTSITSYKITWRSKLSERVLQALCLPAAVPLFLVLCLLTPIAYILHLKEVAKKKRMFRSKIKEFTVEAISFDVPEVKTIGELWKLHGLGKDGYSHDEKLDLLCMWIDALYGTGYSEALDLRKRVQEIAHRHGEANLTPDLHIYFVPPVESLISKLSEELPPYC
jgi:hypothetical protein